MKIFFMHPVGCGVDQVQDKVDRAVRRGEWGEGVGGGPWGVR